MTKQLFSAIATLLLIAGCTTSGTQGGTHAGGTAEPPLVGTEWHLLHFQSAEDSIGKVRPTQDEVYTIQFLPDGTAAAGLSCNRGTGQWTSPDAQKSMGTLRINLAAVTMAACAHESLPRLAADLNNIASFVIRDGKLNLNLKMSGGDYVWVPAK